MAYQQTTTYQAPTVTYQPQTVAYQVGGGGSALAAANAMRARRGLKPFRYSPAMQASVNRSSQTQASRGRMFHTRQPFGDGARGEGVGMSGSASNFTSCYLYSTYSHAAAASVKGRNGRWYHTLQVGGTGTSYGPKGNSRPGQVFRRPARETGRGLFRRWRRR